MNGPIPNQDQRSRNPGQAAPAAWPTAVIITTLTEETRAVLAHLRGTDHDAAPWEVRGTVYDHGSFAGQHGTWTVAVAEIGPGNSTASVEIERAIARFRPAAVLLVGIAGGVKDLRLGDVVAADAVYDHESGKDTDTDYRPRIKTHSSSHRLVQHARRVARGDAWQQHIQPPLPAERPRATVKPVAAGGKLVAGDRSRTAELLRRYCSDAVAVEMEGHGFLAGAYRNPQTEALVVRGISDLLSGKTPEHDEHWQPQAARHAAAFAFAVLDSAGQTAAANGAGTDAEPPNRYTVTITNSQGVHVGDGGVHNHTWTQGPTT